jgi:hypothetical protein
VNVLTIGSQGTQKKGGEQRQARYYALYHNKHENYGHGIAKDMWQMLLKVETVYKQYKKMLGLLTYSTQKGNS